MKNLVIVPTYNEKENIEAIIRKVLSLEKFDILIVDDNSPDGTALIVENLLKEFKRGVHLIKRTGKLGLGTAYIAGFKYGLAKGYDTICEMDADFSHNPDDLLRLHQALTDGADVAIGSRYITGGGFKNWPKNRILISKGGSAYVRIITHIPVKDPTAGFIFYKARVLESIRLDRVKFTGYAFQIEMKYVAWKLGYKLKEIPIVFKDREEGTSKMHIGIIKEAVLGVLMLRFRSIRKYYAVQS